MKHIFLRLLKWFKIVCETFEARNDEVLIVFTVHLGANLCYSLLKEDDLIVGVTVIINLGFFSVVRIKSCERAGGINFKVFQQSMFSKFARTRPKNCNANHVSSSKTIIRRLAFQSSKMSSDWYFQWS